jgi:plastocyanin
MNWRVLPALLLSFGGLPWHVYAQSPAGEFGSIEGVVTFHGDIPKSTTADDAGVRHDLLEVDAATRGLPHVVLYVTRSDGAKLSGPSNLPRELLMDQADYAFTPQVLAVREGEVVTFKNSDPANHNVRARARNRTNEFNVFTGVEGKYEHRFMTETNYRPVRLGCDIHPWMAAWIFVFDHPFFAVTDERGRFRISSLPPGDYDVHVVQPAIAHQEQRKVRVSVNGTSKLEIVIRR